MRRLSKRQKDALEFVRDYYELHGYSPSYREIQAAAGYSNVSAVHGCLHKLQQLGLVRIDPVSARTVVPTQRRRNSPRADRTGALRVPLLGTFDENWLPPAETETRRC